MPTSLCICVHMCLLTLCAYVGIHVVCAPSCVWCESLCLFAFAWSVCLSICKDNARASVERTHIHTHMRNLSHSLTETNTKTRLRKLGAIVFCQCEQRFYLSIARSGRQRPSLQWQTAIASVAKISKSEITVTTFAVPLPPHRVEIVIARPAASTGLAKPFF